MTNHPIESVIDEVHDLTVGPLVNELAAAARRHDVMISITVTPYDHETTVAAEAGERRDRDIE